MNYKKDTPALEVSAELVTQEKYAISRELGNHRNVHTREKMFSSISLPVHSFYKIRFILYM